MLVRVVITRMVNDTRIEYCQEVTDEWVWKYGCQRAIGMVATELAKQFPCGWFIDVERIPWHTWREWKDRFEQIEQAIGGAK